MDNNLFMKLYKFYCDNSLSHIFLIETNNIFIVNNEIINFIKKIEKMEDSISMESLCGLIVIDPIGKNIKKDSILNLKNTFSNKPLFTNNNYYIINQAEKMNITSFNMLLKFMEEPEDNILGFLVTENKDFLPDTIVSRCQVLREYFDEKTKDYCYKDIIENYFKLYNSKSNDVIWYNENVIKKEITERTEYIIFFQEMLNYCLNNIELNIERDLYIRVTLLIKQYLERLEYNVNIDLLINSFALEMVDLYGK